MSTIISHNDRVLIVSNMRWNSLIAFCLEAAAQKANTPKQKTWFTKLTEFHDTSWNGMNIDLHELFSDAEEKKFWADCFRESAKQIFLRRLGNQDVDTWQVGAICDAEVIARMLDEDFLIWQNK